MSKVISKIVVPDSSKLTGYALYNVKDANAIPASEKGAASGVATLDNTGKIPSSQIPGSIVSLLSDWNQTDSTAGDYIKNKPTSMPASDVSSWAKKSTKPSYTKSEVGLGNVGNFLSVSTEASQGLSETLKTNARANIGAGTSSFSGSYNDLSNKPTIPAAAANGTYTVKTLVGSTTTNVSDFTANQSSADDVTFVLGSNVTITPDAANRKITIAAKDTTYSPQSLGNGIGTCSTSSGTALVVTLSGYNLVKNGFVAVTFENDVPAGATLNINSKGAKPIIYKGSAIKANVIKADDTVMFSFDGTNYVVTSLGGGGGSVVFPGFVTIRLTQTGGSDSDLIGTTVVVTNDDTSETVISTTWQGQEIELQVDADVNYSVTVGSVIGYMIEPTQTLVGKHFVNTNIDFLYMGDVVDLGLPSGLKWCTKNIGANTISDRGLYFAWGKTVGYAYGSGHNFTNESTGPTGNLSYSQDAAYANSNGKYRMPTKIEVDELIAYTDKERVVIDGISGVKFMKKTNHDIYIFLPGAAWYFQNSYGVAGTLSYWASTYERVNLLCDNNTLNVKTSNGNSSNGCTVRGVKI